MENYSHIEGSHHYSTVAKAISYIRGNYTRQPDLDEVAEHVHLSRFHFQRVFTEWAGISPKEFLQFITLEEAKKALARGQSTLQAAWETGLSGSSRLHDLFVKFESCTPGEYRTNGEGVTVFIDEIDSPFGRLAMAETEKGISHMIFGTPDELKALDHLKKADFRYGSGRNGEKVRQYFQTWEIPGSPISLDIVGTSFQIQVWRALLTVPPSGLVTYQDLAGVLKIPKAVRAVGTALGRNPVAYLIPCHRVIKSNGDFGNYHWDPDRKVVINAYEAAVLSGEYE